jgi:cobalt-zinc-cadmium efflux system protein
MKERDNKPFSEYTRSVIDNVIDIHHIHIWTIDGINNYLTMHVVTDSKDINKLKKKIKDKLKEKNISHVTLEIEDKIDNCDETECYIEEHHNHSHHHHH